MTIEFADHSEQDGHNALRSFERALIAVPLDPAVARRALLTFLRHFAGDGPREQSIADLLEVIAKGQVAKLVAVALLRSLSVPGIVPDKTVGASIPRSIVEICERALPAVCKFVKLDPGSQTFAKYQKLGDAHASIEHVLSPLLARFASIENAVQSQRSITGALSHSAVVAYAGPLGSADIKLHVEVISAKLSAVARFGMSLPDDMQAARKAVASARTSIAESPTFITERYLQLYLQNVDQILDDLMVSLGERFATDIAPYFDKHLAKRYPLHDAERQLRINVPFRNHGPGIAVDLRVLASSSNVALEVNNENIVLGDVAPGQFSVIVDTKVLSPAEIGALVLIVEWSEVGSPQRRSDIFEVEILAQATNIDWPANEYRVPYSTEPAQGDAFFGRVERVKQIGGKILRTTMEPFYITGQKRVGKTSLVNASVDFAEKTSPGHDVVSKYILWGDIAHENPHGSLRELGRRVSDVVFRNVNLMGLDRSDCSESLAPLISLFQFAYEIDASKKFVLIIDEFDEVHPELYLHGNLAETFFANLRALSRCKNVCVGLVGGENMPYVMDRQGQKLNNFSKISLSYYNRSKEWEDYRLLVSKPAADVLAWHDDAISEIFNLTNGNPYFTKIICAAVWDAAIQERDADVTADEVRAVVSEQISQLGANSFAHLWQDGISKAIADRDPETLARVQVLIAIGRCLRDKQAVVLENLLTYRAAAELGEGGVVAVLNDFSRREILVEKDGRYSVFLPIFSRWLEDAGVVSLISTGLSDELARVVLDAEAAATVRSEEIAQLVKSWPTYRGKHVGSDDVRAWLEQVPGQRNQRILFKLLSRLRFFRDEFIRERLETLHNTAVLPHLEEFVIKRRSDRRKDVAVTYVDGEGKSGWTYASYYAEQNLIASECIVPPRELSDRISELSKGGAVRALVIVDDLAATGKSLAGNVKAFLDANREALLSSGLRVIVCTIAATAEARSFLDRSFSRIDWITVEYRTAELLTPSDSAFSDVDSMWDSESERDIARALCTDLGAKIHGRATALGFGNQALLTVFADSIPNNALPILHSPSRSGQDSWIPLFQRVLH